MSHSTHPIETPINPDGKRDEELFDIDNKSLKAVDNDADVYVDPVIEKRILRKLDYHLAPIFMSLYFLSYLNRSNIGNAAVAGMNDQLNLSPGDYSTAVSVFYATYVGLIFPIVLALRKIKPHRAITVMSIAWSLVTIGTAFCKSYGALVACRLLLGACEAGFFPCIS
jgi:MFS family permease